MYTTVSTNGAVVTVATAPVLRVIKTSYFTASCSIITPRSAPTSVVPVVEPAAPRWKTGSHFPYSTTKRLRVTKTTP